jgi:hypothetical protein
MGGTGVAESSFWKGEGLLWTTILSGSACRVPLRFAFRIEELQHPV